MTIKEEDIQKHVAHYLDNLEFMLSKAFTWFHIPNGGKMSPARGRKLKEMGVKAGVADIAIITKPGSVIFIELKTGTGKLSTKQKEFMAKCEITETPYHVVRAASFQSALDQVDDILSMYGIKEARNAEIRN